MGHTMTTVRECADKYRADVLVLSAKTEQRLMAVLKTAKKRLAQHDGQVAEGHSLLDAAGLRLIEVINRLVSWKAFLACFALPVSHCEKITHLTCV